ncbi:MAG: MarR family transcriptional regulator [Leptolyngbyaceae bacterium]|nr:MarR family transcriptional regulator [Leptolyngbyaceae bacterium]
MSLLPNDATVQAKKESFIPTMRSLVRAYQAFSGYSEAHIRQLDLTPSQFDVIATLGNTRGMSMGEIGEKTLITKGTLTGVIDRLVSKELVVREIPPDNRRNVMVQLTPKGQEKFERDFPAHINHIKARFERLEPSELELLSVLLQRLQQVFAE